MFDGILYKEAQYQNAMSKLEQGKIAELEQALEPFECACLGPINACPCILQEEAIREAIEIFKGK